MFDMYVAFPLSNVIIVLKEPFLQSKKIMC